MFWVLATLIDSRIVVDSRYVGLLTERERPRLYEEWLLVADAFGIPRSVVPTDLVSFRAYVSQQIANLKVEEDARRIADLVLRPAFIRLPRPMLAAFRALVVDLLPSHVRRLYGFPEHLRAEPFTRLLQAGSRAVFTRLPREMRARSLDERIRSGSLHQRDRPYRA